MPPSKIAVLTLPLGGNYGGILQAYALQTYLRDVGLEASTTHIREFGFLESIARFGYYFAKRVVHMVRPSASTFTPDLIARQYEQTQRFIDRHISLIEGRLLYRQKSAGEYRAVVVGSDQVWRKRYVSIPTYLLDFTETWDITRISYAASFGKNDLSEYKPSLIRRSAELANRFDSISVREDSAIDLVQNFWQLEAEHHLDPTMLLDSLHYLDLIEQNKEDVRASAGNLFAYVLDYHEPKGGIIGKTASQLNLKPFNMIPPKANSRREFLADLERYQLPPVPQWLQSFADAKFVVTDSFHGTVFAILFHKPFLVIGNERRGLARFTSLLKTFGLEERMVDDIDDVTEELLLSPINWDMVEDVLRIERERSRDYLTRHLSARQ